MNNSSDGVFDRALINAQQVEETFYLNFSSNGTIAQNLHESDDAVRQRVRAIMESSVSPTRFLFDFTTFGSEFDAQVAQDLASGAIAAIDSTDMLPLTNVMNTAFYSTGVSLITSRNRGQPEVVLTSTNTRYTDPVKVTSDDLGELCDELDRAREAKSWSTTFREYQERQAAINCNQKTVLIDGPVFTQNLITQTQGRDLYRQMLATDKRFIGIIKELSGSWTLCKWTAMSLERGEGFVICLLKDQYGKRFGNDRSITSWINGLQQEYIRGVYRPAEKAFAFECNLEDLPYTISLLRQNASPTLNHEIPLLLETVDWHLRGSNNSEAIKSSFISEIQRNDYRMGLDITEERGLR